jgi:hypothetical protein
MCDKMMVFDCLRLKGWQRIDGWRGGGEKRVHDTHLVEK